MIGRGLGIALLVSLAVHIFFMTAVIIVNPAASQRFKTHPKVDFLGPLLKKTAFDIMLESANPMIRTSYGKMDMSGSPNYLRAAPPGRRSAVEEPSVPYLYGGIEEDMQRSLAGVKSLPAFLLTGDGGFFGIDGVSSSARQVIFRPKAPALIKGVYGKKVTFSIRVKVLISGNGAVKSAEPVTYSGYPQLDLTAVKFVKSWLFEPGERDQTQEVEVVLTAEGD